MVSKKGAQGSMVSKKGAQEGSMVSKKGAQEEGSMVSKKGAGACHCVRTCTRARTPARAGARAQPTRLAACLCLAGQQRLLRLGCALLSDPTHAHEASRVRWLTKRPRVHPIKCARLHEPSFLAAPFSQRNTWPA